MRLKLKNDPSTKRQVRLDSSQLKDPLIQETYTYSHQGDLNEYRRLNGACNSSIRQDRERTDQAANLETAAERNDQIYSLLLIARQKLAHDNAVSSERTALHHLH
ncbi:hypothetical protein Bbelb_079670 [Branchiostoma belcheri]|nr:hypothetical protein Bbelb_079670 [Branchiostoma belcheri]